MKRKDFIKKSIIGLTTIPIVANSCVPAPSEDISSTTSSTAPNIISGKKYKWKMVTTWPPNFPVLGVGATKFADWVKEMSAGRIDIKVYGGGELVPPLETFGAVSGGVAEMGSSCAYYWAGKTPAAQFFAAVPFGMNAQQLTSWMLSGGAYEKWKNLYANFNLVPFLAGNTGVQMGGWFNKEINSVEDLKGLKMRIPGIAGKVLEKAGGAAVLVAGGEIYTSLERGVIDATEWLHPFHDSKMGFHKISKYYYTPGWHEPGTQLELIINKKIYDSLPKDLQAILWAGSMNLHTWLLAEFDAQNRIYYQQLLQEDGIQIKTFPDDVLQTLKQYTEEAVEELIGDDAFSREVYDSYRKFQKEINAWSSMSEKAYYNKIMK